MGRSNWKTKLVVGVAFILSIIAGVLAAMFAPDVWKGLVGFGTFAIVLLVLVFIFIKVFSNILLDFWLFLFYRCYSMCIFNFAYIIWSIYKAIYFGGNIPSCNANNNRKSWS